MKTIEEYAFTGCEALKEMFVPLSVETIEEKAFRNSYMDEDLMVICAPAGSAAQIYAEQNNHRFEKREKEQ